jgi:hypothetical protein
MCSTLPVKLRKRVKQFFSWRSQLLSPARHRPLPQAAHAHHARDMLTVVSTIAGEEKSMDKRNKAAELSAGIRSTIEQLATNAMRQDRVSCSGTT